jgi:hypothetical protein
MVAGLAGVCASRAPVPSARGRQNPAAVTAEQRERIRRARDAAARRRLKAEARAFGVKHDPLPESLRRRERRARAKQAAPAGAGSTLRPQTRALDLALDAAHRPEAPGSSPTPNPAPGPAGTRGRGLDETLPRPQRSSFRGRGRPAVPRGSSGVPRGPEEISPRCRRSCWRSGSTGGCFFGSRRSANAAPVSASGVFAGPRPLGAMGGQARVRFRGRSGSRRTRPARG